mgnify:CR=1 FL=1
MMKNQVVSWQKIRFLFGNFSSFAQSAILIVIVLLFDRLMISSGAGFAASAPFLAVGLSWVWFLLPGLVLSYLLAREVSWWERVPLSFVLTIGLITPISIFAILQHYTLDDFIVLHSSILLLQVVVLIIVEWRSYRTKELADESVVTSIPAPKTNKRNFSALFILAVIIVIILAVLAFEWPLFGDEVAGLSIFAEVIQQNQITGTEPFHGTGIPVTPRNELIVWTYSAILTNYVSGASPSEFFVNSRPFLVIIALLSLVILLNQFLKNKHQVLFFLCFWGIYLLSTLQADGSGNDFITRIIQDKFLGWFVVIPVLLTFMLWFLEGRGWVNLVGFGLVTFGASMVHPITLTQAMILTAGFGVIHFLFDRSRKTVISLGLIALVLVLCTIIPFYQYLRFNDYSPIQMAGLGDAVEFGQLSSSVGRYRLWMLGDGGFILHPIVILEPVIIAAYILMPSVIFSARKTYLSRLVIGSLFILPILLYTPTFAGLAGRVVTPYLIWRLAWPFPLLAVMAVAGVLWQQGQRLKDWLAAHSSLPRVNNILYPSLIIIILFVAAPGIYRGFSDYRERRIEINLSTCITAENVLSYLNEIADEKSVNVLASHSLNFCIPGYAALANVVEFRGYGTVNRLTEENLEESLQRIDDVNYFSVTKYYDDLFLNAIIRHQIDYVLLEKERLELDLQLKYLPATFQAVYEDANYSLYAIQKPVMATKIVEANTALRTNQYTAALKLFNQLLQEQPTNLLAYSGIGLAQSGLGKYDQAIGSFQKAIQIAPTEAILHGQLANIHILKENIDSAIEEYKLATNLAPSRYSLYASLGQVYILAGQHQAARASFEQATSLVTVKGSAGYYSTLGHLYYSVNLPAEAIQLFTQAISIEADISRYIDLARVLSTAGKTEEAIQVYQQAMEADRWNYLPHLELGYLYLEQDHIDEAINELEIACQLKPTNVSAYIMLGRAIEEQAGLEAALARLEALKNVSDVLPGPSRGIASLLFGSGDYEPALDELGFSASIQPKNAAILIAKGYISMAEGETGSAQEDFNQALLYKPDLISARLGLSLFYTAESEYELATSQFIQIVQLIPLTAWSHLNLSQAYQQQGYWELARNEIELAIKLEPNNVQGYIARAELNVTLLAYEQAITDYELVLKIDPKNETALLGLGDVYFNLANLAEAERIYQSAISINATSVYPKIKLLDLYWQQGRYEDVAALEQVLLNLAPDSEIVIIKLADLYRKQGRIEEAKALYERLIQSDPSEVTAYAILAQLLAEGDNDQYILLSLYNDLISENPESAEAYLVVGQFYIDQGQYDVAERVLQKALYYKNATVDNYIALSQLQQKYGEWQAALTTLVAAREKFPAQAVIYTELGNYHLDAGYSLIAKVYFSQALEYDPTFASAYVGLSQIERINGDFQQAEAILQNAIINNPGAFQILLALADFQESTGNTKLAEETFIRAVAIKPSDINLQRSLGEFYMRQQRFAEASVLFEKALQLPGTKLDVYLDLGDLSLAENSPEEAIQWFEMARDIDQSNIKPYLALASVYQETNEWDKALQTLNTSLSLAPANVEVNLALGEYYQRLGYYDESSLYIQRASKFDRSLPSIKVLLAAIYRDKGQWEQAADYLEQAIESSPLYLPAYTALSQIMQWKEDFQHAEAILSEGIKRVIDKQDAYQARAAFYEQQGSWELAQADYERAWRLLPNSQSSGLVYVDFLTRRNDLEHASAVLSEMENHFGAEAELSIEYGNIYSVQAKWGEARQAYQQAVTLDPSNANGYLGLAHVLEALGDIQGAIEIYQAASLEIQNSSEVFLGLGTALQTQAKYEQAYLAFQEALKLDPMNSTGLLKIEQLNRIMGKPETDLLAYVQHALTQPSSEIFIALSDLYTYRGEWELAYTWLQRSVSIEPCDGKNWTALGNYYLTLAQWDNALEAFGQALIYTPDSFETWLAKGSVEENLGALDRAQDSYLRAIEINPGSIEGYIALSKLLYQEENHELAIEKITKGITHAPADYRGYQALGELYIAIDPSDSAKAEEVYQTGLRVLPGTPELITSIADLYTKQALDASERLETSQAIELLTQNRLKYLTDLQATSLSRQQSRVVELKVEQAMQIVGLYHARAEAAQQAYEETESSYELASEYYQQALSLKPNFETALLGMGKLQLARASMSESIAYFEQAVTANPHSTLSLGYLGNIYLELGQPEKALAYFEQILAYEPGNMLAQVGVSYAYQDTAALDISQAAESVEQSQFKLQFLVQYFRDIQG